MPSLLMIIPSRGRPGNLDRLLEAWRTTASGYADLVVALDDDDPDLFAYDAGRVAMVTVGPRRSFVAWTNELAVRQAANYRFIGSMGDDHRPRTPGWDRMLCEALEKLGSGIAYGDDLAGGEPGPSAVAVTSDVVRRLGYLIPPVLAHHGGARFWLDLGRALGRCSFLPEVVIEHLHYTTGKSSVDPGYLRTAAEVERDQGRYEAYRRDHFGTAVGCLASRPQPTDTPAAPLGGGRHGHREVARSSP